MSGFVPPPYPYDRLNRLKPVTDAHSGGTVDLSIGTPFDPPPAAVIEAKRAELRLDDPIPLRFLGWLGDQAGKKFDDLPDTTRNTLEKYNIGSDRWDIIRNTDLEDYKGNKFVRPSNIEDRTVARGAKQILEPLLDPKFDPHSFCRR